MAQYLLTVYRAKGFDPASSVDNEMSQAIDALNDKMIDSGIRVFVGGLMSPELARSLRLELNGDITTAKGAYIDTTEYIDGLWVLEVPDIETAEEWGRRAALACRASVEVRPFYG